MHGELEHTSIAPHGGFSAAPEIAAFNAPCLLTASRVPGEPLSGGGRRKSPCITFIIWSFKLMLTRTSLFLSIRWAEGVKFLLFVSSVRICKREKFSSACLGPCLYANDVVTFLRLKDLILASISQSICQPCQKRNTAILSGQNKPKLLLEYRGSLKT